MKKNMPHIVMIVLCLFLTPLHAGTDVKHPRPQKWSFMGMFGTFDRAQLQRGFQVYKQVCSSCHGLKLVYYRNLKDLGYNAAEIKTIANDYTVRDGPNDDGEMFDRPARPSDSFVSPYANEKAARAVNNGSYPLDLSLITKARHFGPHYLHSLLTGYREPPTDVKLMDGMHYNPYFPSGQIAMAPPLIADAVTYADGTPATVHNMAKDVTAFLVWASDPNQEARKSLGLKVLIYLIFLAILFYISMKRIWRNLDEDDYFSPTASGR